MRNRLFVLLFLLIPLGLMGQNGDEAFHFLRLPNSTRANALGGHSVALVERDPSLVFHNPALLGGEMDKMINLNYMNYASGVNTGSALFTKAIREHNAWGVAASFYNYGTIKETTEANQIIGTFSPTDIAMMGFYSHDLSARWRGGLTFKMLYSSIADYTSLGVAVDAGLSYYNSEKEFSFGVTLKNIGAQLKAYDNARQSMPWDIQLGITKKMNHAPIRFSLTAMHLNRWSFDYVDEANKEYTGDNFFQSFIKHFVFGIDYVPSDNFWLGVGYNPKRGMDMRLVGGGSGLAGFSAGAGVKIKMFDVGISVAQYNPSALSLMLSVSMTLDDFKN